MQSFFLKRSITVRFNIRKISDYKIVFCVALGSLFTFLILLYSLLYSRLCFPIQNYSGTNTRAIAINNDFIYYYYYFHKINTYIEVLSE